MTEPAVHTLSETERADLARAHRAARWVTIYLPTAVTLLGLALVLLWLPRLPNPVATHWSGFSQAPDGFGSPLGYLALSVGLGLGMTILFTLIVFLGGRGGTMPVWSPYQRCMGAFGLGTVVFLQLITVGSVALQLDLSDARHAPPIGGLVGLGFASWIVVAVIGWFGQPNVSVGGGIDSEPGANGMELGDTERAVWVGETRMSKPFLVTIVLTLILILAATILIAISGSPAWWGMAPIFLLVAVLFACMSWFWVRVDASGLEVRSIVGWPTVRVPADDIAEATAAQVNPLAEFGGWGMRWAPGRFGVVPRSGTGIVVQRRSGKLFVVVVDDAETAAALLTAVAANATRPGGGPGVGPGGEPGEGSGGAR